MGWSTKYISTFTIMVSTPSPNPSHLHIKRPLLYVLRRLRKAHSLRRLQLVWGDTDLTGRLFGLRDRIRKLVELEIKKEGRLAEVVITVT